MPWLAIPFSEYDAVEELNHRYGITGIPALVVVNNDGSFGRKNGRELVASYPRSFPWGIPLSSSATEVFPLPDVSVVASQSSRAAEMVEEGPGTLFYGRPGK